ncbi:DUF808 domain-containing protein [Propioniciclava tarda]|uniref:DUF808 domain-containing protein n=1 Tax=Propioniciclava tarda TaxID=433330 RepID=A0A4Q9KP05_PROTD|nr:DUF808 domain-containing protein [Propioniciclava tarda]TBT96346.1 DUF808 domain-containing protein [Propioniciclava tarda]SMO36040.1 hypothetical protein SAMN06266982_101285 [Propioniciclava tarda]HOA88379.1 DUF808 domain-containing protein [Propioniciclava tarda]HQA30637.1 DUF808 domain-containing protein [Propioniciclava tarda]HQD61184.1 DUF808 domain-containing protein [Propioniciclava tarda]
MAGGLAALLDDVAAIAKMASAASTKAVGVVVDDTAVTPRFIQGVSPARELPIIGKIALGSLRNKLVFILPAILLLSQFLPWALTPLLMLGGAYLCYEGAEKVYEVIVGHHETPTGEAASEQPALRSGAEAEKALVRGAITTDFILSSEIMVISLDQVAEAEFVYRAVSLIVVAIAITALVYGVVALIVKMDDVGLHLAAKPASRGLGMGLVKAMPVVLSALSGIGIAAMLWVGGHIIVAGAAELGWHAPLDLIHVLAGPAEHVHAFLGWLVDTLCSALVGLVIGGVLVGVLHLVPRKKSDQHAAAH